MPRLPALFILSPADRLITVLIQKSALSRFGRTLQAPRTRSVAGWSPGKMVHAHLTPQSTQLLSGPFRASVLRPQLPSNSQRMCLLLALRFARPSRAPAPRRPRTQRDHLPSATLFDSGFPKSWALSRQCASIPFGSSTTRCGSSQELSQRISPRPQTVEWRRAVRLNGTR
jgi:hypothetical protein